MKFQPVRGVITAVFHSSIVFVAAINRMIDKVMHISVITVIALNTIMAVCLVRLMGYCNCRELVAFSSVHNTEVFSCKAHKKLLQSTGWLQTHYSGLHEQVGQPHRDRLSLIPATAADSICKLSNRN